MLRRSLTKIVLTLHSVSELFADDISAALKAELLAAHQCLNGRRESVAIFREFLDHLIDAFPVLETMTQADYHEIRLALGRGSGADSPGFNELLDVLPKLKAPYEAAIARSNFDLLTLFRDPHKPEHRALYDVSMGMLAVDRCFQHFRYRHLQLARTQIGLAVKSLKGVPARAMQPLTSLKPIAEQREPSWYNSTANYEKATNQAVAKQLEYDTHYTKFGPAGNEFDFVTTVTTASIAQLGFWVPFAVVCGFASGAFFAKRPASQA